MCVLQGYLAHKKRNAGEEDGARVLHHQRVPVCARMDGGVRSGGGVCDARDEYQHQRMHRLSLSLPLSLPLALSLNV